ncbi:MAG: carboxypeptidase regulatory-like domain-containing protein [Gemmatimonadaceae bacterium]|nr:carboxypeptidase regulatory-like domain-containing protein [Gemmatimonadaceae bacterium]
MIRWTFTRMSRFALVGVGATLACSIPTDLCGCPPARSAVYVRGTLTDANGLAIAGARVYLDGVPTGTTADLLALNGFGASQTDADGAFRGLAYSMFSPGPLALRAAVVRPGLPDTVRLAAGLATFRYERDRPDTVSVDLRLP